MKHTKSFNNDYNNYESTSIRPLLQKMNKSVSVIGPSTRS